jgi:hypothetical protein
MYIYTYICIFNTYEPHGIRLANIIYVQAFPICCVGLMMTPSQGRNM